MQMLEGKLQEKLVKGAPLNPCEKYKKYKCYRLSEWEWLKKNQVSCYIEALEEYVASFDPVVEVYEAEEMYYDAGQAVSNESGIAEECKFEILEYSDCENVNQEISDEQNCYEGVLCFKSEIHTLPVYFPLRGGGKEDFFMDESDEDLELDDPIFVEAKNRLVRFLCDSGCGVIVELKMNDIEVDDIGPIHSVSLVILIFKREYTFVTRSRYYCELDTLRNFVYLKALRGLIKIYCFDPNKKAYVYDFVQDLRKSRIVGLLKKPIDSFGSEATSLKVRGKYRGPKKLFSRDKSGDMVETDDNDNSSLARIYMIMKESSRKIEKRVRYGEVLGEHESEINRILTYSSFLDLDLDTRTRVTGIDGNSFNDSEYDQVRFEVYKQRLRDIVKCLKLCNVMTIKVSSDYAHRYLLYKKESSLKIDMSVVKYFFKMAIRTLVPKSYVSRLVCMWVIVKRRHFETGKIISQFVGRDRLHVLEVMDIFGIDCTKFMGGKPLFIDLVSNELYNKRRDIAQYFALERAVRQKPEYDLMDLVVTVAPIHMGRAFGYQFEKAADLMNVYMAFVVYFKMLCQGKEYWRQLRNLDFKMYAIYDSGYIDAFRRIEFPADTLVNKILGSMNYRLKFLPNDSYPDSLRTQKEFFDLQSYVCSLIYCNEFPDLEEYEQWMGPDLGEDIDMSDASDGCDFDYCTNESVSSNDEEILLDDYKIKKKE